MDIVPSPKEVVCKVSIHQTAMLIVTKVVFSHLHIVLPRATCG